MHLYPTRAASLLNMGTCGCAARPYARACAAGDALRGAHSYSRSLDARPQVYFLSAAFFAAGALDADFGIDVVGTMMWA